MQSNVYIDYELIYENRKAVLKALMDGAPIPEDTLESIAGFFENLLNEAEQNGEFAFPELSDEDTYSEYDGEYDGEYDCYDDEKEFSKNGYRTGRYDEEDEY